MKNNKGFVGIFIIIGILIAGGATYALVPRTVLKSFFEVGDKPNQEEKKLAPTDIKVDTGASLEVSGNKPTEAQFKNVIDSGLNLTDDKELSGLKESNTTKGSLTGETSTDTSVGTSTNTSVNTSIKAETETGASTR